MKTNLRRPEPRPNNFLSAPDWATIHATEDGTEQGFYIPLRDVAFIDSRDLAAGLWTITWRDDSAPDGWRIGVATLDQILCGLGWHIGLHADRCDQERLWRRKAVRQLPSPSASVH